MSEYSSSDQYAGVNIYDAKAAFDDVGHRLSRKKGRYKPGKEGWYESPTDTLTHENSDRTTWRAKVRVDQDTLAASNIVFFEQYEQQTGAMDTERRQVLSRSIGEYNLEDYDWILLSKLVRQGVANVRIQTLVQTSYEFPSGELPIKRMTGTVAILGATGRRFILDDTAQGSPHEAEVFDQIKRNICTLVPEDLVTIRSVLRLFE